MAKRLTEKLDGYVVMSPARKWLASFLPYDYEADRVISHVAKNKFKLLCSNKEFLLRVLELRNEFGLSSLDGNYDNWVEPVFGKKAKRLLFDRKINELLRDFKASQRWRRVFGYRVIFGKVPDSVFPNAFDFYISPDRDSIVVELNRDTTIDDLKRGWKTIEEQKTALNILDSDIREKSIKGEFLTPYRGGVRKLKLIKSKRKTKELELKKCKKAYELRVRGKSYKEIASELGISDKYHVNTYINRYKRELSENELY